MTREEDKKKSALIDRYEQEVWDERFKPAEDNRNSRAKHIGDAVYDAMIGIAAKLDGRDKPDLHELSGGIKGSAAHASANYYSSRHDKDEMLTLGFAAILKGQQLCESPIEKHLLPWLVFASWSFADFKPITVATDMSCPEKVFILPQARVGGYRIDFLVVRRFKGGLHRVAVECDGVEFHGGARDHKRDYDLIQTGVFTIRASGREIYDRPHLVVARVEEAFYKLEG